MPKFGTYTANRVPVAASGASFSVPGERRSPVTVPRTGEVTWGAAREVAGAAGDIAAKMRNARQIQELADAQVKNRRLFADIDAQLQDPDFLSQTDPDEFERIFDERSGEGWQAVSGGMTDDRAKKAARNDFENLRVSYLTRTRSRARNLQIETGRASTDQQLRDLQEVLLRGDAEGDTRAAADALVTAQGIVAGKVSAGYFSAEEGDRLLENFRKDATGTIWARRIQNDPAGAFIELSKNKSIPNMLESERVTLQKMSRAAYSAMLRTRIQAANLQDRQDEKALKLIRQQTAGKYWVEIQNGRNVSQGSLDKDLMLQRLDLDEYRALSAAARNPDGVVTDDPQVVLEIERSLDDGDFDTARQLAYGGIESGRLTNGTGIGYVDTARSAVKSGITSDRTAAGKLLRTMFQQDGLLPDPSLHDKYQKAVVEMIRAERMGKNPLSTVVDIFKRDIEQAQFRLGSWYTGPVTMDGIIKFQGVLKEQLKAGKISESEYKGRFYETDRVLKKIKLNEEIKAQVQQLRDYLK